jgi:hypothetical protein
VAGGEAVTTAVEIITALRVHYAAPAWAFVEQVGDATGYGASRHIDALAMGLWPSRGLEIHGIEVKISRNDWKRELLKPDKAEPIAERCDRFYVATPAGLVDPFELPPAWGLLEVRKDGKVHTVKAADKREPKPLDYPFLAAIMRRVALVPSPTAQMQDDLRQAAREEARKDVDERIKHAVELALMPLESLRRQVAEFEAETGIQLAARGWRWPTGAEFGRAVLYVANGGHERVVRDLESIERTTARITEAIAAARADLDPVTV